MFYQKGVDITNDKQMFNFLKNHFEYCTANSWNRMSSIANNVKLYNLDLSGDWGVALALLEAGEYETINMMISDWELEHRGYEVFFNGRNGGYLVLVDKDGYGPVLSDEIRMFDTYEEYKEWCRDEYGSVKANRADLVKYTKLVQDFDKLCDQLRDYCDELSRQSFEIVEMNRIVDQFNDDYENDLELLGFDYLRVNDAGEVDIAEIYTLQCLAEAFQKIADRKALGYRLAYDCGTKVKLEQI